MKYGRVIVVLLVALALGGCAYTQAKTQHEQARVAAVEAAAGAPVNSFRYDAISMYAWEPLNDHEVLIYTQPHKAWLLNVGYCPNLPFTSFIGITSNVGRVSRGLDRLVLNGGRHGCYIQKIQPVDVHQLQRQMHARKGAKLVPEPASS